MVSPSVAFSGRSDRAKGQGWRRQFKKPRNFNERTFGFFFRFANGIASVLLGFVVLCLIGLINGWEVHIWMIIAYGVLISLMVFFGEIIRVALYERIIQIEDDDIVVSINPNGLPKISGLKEPNEVYISEAYTKKAPTYRTSFARCIKRVIDVFLSMVLLVLLLPLICTVAVSVKLSSPGPIFFKQTRANFRGETFGLFKFRSMCLPDDVPGKLPFDVSGKNDPRITSIGRMLRLTRLDEIPQLFNVLKGEMSLVGPRPLHPQIDVHVYFADLDVSEIAEFEPGITGLAVVEGIDGQRSYEDFLARWRRDIYYVRHWSLWLDFSILARTLITVLFFPGR